MEEIKDSLNIALEIINTLLQNKEIKKSENTELYQQYVGNDEVESLCDMIAEKMGFNIYRLDNTLNLCVMIENKVFGYSNEDLKKKIKILNKNEDIYLMYFIILTIITCFYRESGLNSPRSYLGLDELIETINIKFQSLVKEDIEKIHLAEDMLQKYWNSGKMPITMNKVLRQCKSPFYFFLDLGEFYQAQQFKFFGFQLDELFQYINIYLKEQYEDELIEDYLRLSKVKPKKWWKTRIDNEKEIKHRLIEKYQLNQEDVFRYGIVEKLKEDYILVIYKNYQVHVEKYHI